LKWDVSPNGTMFTPAPLSGPDYERVASGRMAKTVPKTGL
jgi:hypothetical protein